MADDTAKELNEDWFQYPDGFVDPVDLDGKTKQEAIQIIRDLIVDRSQVEYFKFKQMFYKSLKHEIKLTDHQQIALHWERVALEQGKPPHKISAFISEKMGMHRDNAKRLINRAHNRMDFVRIIDDRQEIVGLGDLIPFYSDTGAHIELDPNEIKRVYAGIVIHCPTYGANATCLGQARARYGLCSECASVYGRHQDDRPAWLQADIQLLQRQAWQNAKEQVFHRHHVINLDINDVA